MVALTALSCLFAMPGTASAAQQTNYNIDYCYSGVFQGSGENNLSNGRLSFGWCATSGKATTVTVKYHKDAGANVKVQFGYEWVDADGSPTAGRHWDQSANNVVTVQATQTWGARFKRDPAEAAPSSSTKCIRGLMKADGVVYSTRIVC
jgi:hypothetical protein